MVTYGDRKQQFEEFLKVLVNRNYHNYFYNTEDIIC